METAGAGDMPEDAERKGLGTPATRAATLEKLVSAGFVQRKKKAAYSNGKRYEPDPGPAGQYQIAYAHRGMGIHAEAGGTRRTVRRVLYGADCGYEPDTGKGAYRPRRNVLPPVPGC